MKDLYIDDDDFEPYNTMLTEIDTALETKLSNIIDLTQKACNGVESGDFHDNLVTFATELNNMKGVLNEFTLRMQTNSTEFLGVIKEIDESIVV